MNKDQCLKLISLYGANNWLWDARDPNYTNRGLREDAWLNISREMNLPVSDLKKKMESLMGSYRREKSREKKSLITGSGRDDVYKSNWFGYNSFAFMSDRHDPGSTQDTLENNEIDTNDGTESTQEPTTDGTVSAQGPTCDDGNVQVVEDQQQIQSDTNNTQSRIETLNQRSRKRSKKRPVKEPEDLSDETISEAFRLLQQCAEPQPAPQPACDSFSAFGQYIANELRKYDPITLAHVKNDICKIIFQADTGAYQQYGYYTEDYISYARPSSHASSYSSIDPNTPSPLPPQSPIQSTILYPPPPPPPPPPVTSQNP